MLIIFVPTSGNLSLSDMQSQLLREQLQRNEGMEMQLSVEPYKHPRTNQQNKYLWSVVYKAISDHTGHHVNEIHDACKKMFLAPNFVRMGSKEEQIAGSTTELSTKEFGEYVDRVIAFAGTELSMAIPPPSP